MDAYDRQLLHEVDTAAVMIKRSMGGSTTRWTHRAIAKVVYARFRHPFSSSIISLAIFSLEDTGWLTRAIVAPDMKTEVNYG